MTNPLEASVDIRKYLKKLQYTIDNEAVFTLLNVKIVDKKRIDDILCCLEASWPDEYKAYISRDDVETLKSYTGYTQLLLAIKNKFLFSTDVYAVQYKNVHNIITVILNSIESDINYILNR